MNKKIRELSTKLAALEAEHSTLLEQADSGLEQAEAVKERTYAALVQTMADGGNVASARKAHEAADAALASAKIIRDAAQVRATRMQAEIEDVRQALDRERSAYNSRRRVALKAALNEAVAEHKAAFDSVFFKLRRAQALDAELHKLDGTPNPNTPIDRAWVPGPRGELVEIYGMYHAERLAAIQAEAAALGTEQ